MPLSQILLAEDDRKIADSVAHALRAERYEVHVARDGLQTQRLLSSQRFDLLILDLRLPGLRGEEILGHLRGQQEAPAVIVLTAQTDLETRLQSFSLGADDYVAKPFFLGELLARVGARLRALRPALTSPEGFSFEDIVVDPGASEVRRSGVLLPLTPSERSLLFYLVERPGRAVTRGQLIQGALRGIEAADERTVDAHIARLRKKLGPGPGAWVETVWGLGYEFRRREEPR